MDNKAFNKQSKTLTDTFCNCDVNMFKKNEVNPKYQRQKYQLKPNTNATVKVG